MRFAPGITGLLVNLPNYAAVVTTDEVVDAIRASR
jgi:hypothetical protein